MAATPAGRYVWTNEEGGAVLLVAGAWHWLGRGKGCAIRG